MKKVYFSLLFTLGTLPAAFSQVAAPADRIYANSESHGAWGLGLGSITDAGLAIDDSSSTSSTLSIGLALVAGGYQQTLTFADPVPANTAVHVKIGTNASAVSVAGYTTVTAYDANGNSVATTGNITVVGLLGGENTYEEILTGSSPIKTVRVALGSTVGIGITANVFGAYYETPGTGAVSSKPFDVLEGTETTALLNAASILSGVSNPYNSIDGDTSTYATIFATANVAAQQQLTALLPGLYPAGTYAHILIEDPGQLLSLSLLNAPLTIQLLNNGTVTQSTATDGWNLIGLELLGSGSSAKGWLNIQSTAPFNQVKVISNSGVATLISSLNVYEFTADNSPNESLPLPISYSKELSASYIKNNVLLAWSTATEINNNYFDVQRSADSKSWSSIGQVKSKVANGTGNGANYSFTDATPLTGINYYRLVQTDFDGKTAISNTVSLNTDEATSTSLKLYPNPAHDVITIDGLQSGNDVAIYNVTGNLVQHFKATANIQQIDIHNLVTGVYYVKVLGAKIIKTGTFIIR